MITLYIIKFALEHLKLVHLPSANSQLANKSVLMTIVCRQMNALNGPYDNAIILIFLISVQLGI